MLTFSENSDKPPRLSGIQSLTHSSHPGYNAFDPTGTVEIGLTGGLNFEHIICGDANEYNAETPRKGHYCFQLDGSQSNAISLVRRANDGPWLVASKMKHTVVPPHYVDFEFECQPHDAKRFGKFRYGMFMWANYMNDVQDIGLHFRGVAGPNQPESWIRADSATVGSIYACADAPKFQLDRERDTPAMNMECQEYPRYSKPFFYGLANHGMVFMLMFDRGYSEREEIRFAQFKFAVTETKRCPAWDFQYIAREIESMEKYGFRGRMVWKPFQGEDDCLAEYKNWRKSLAALDPQPAS